MTIACQGTVATFSWTTSHSSSGALALSQNVSAGDFLVIWLNLNTSGGTGQSASDTQSNTYTAQSLGTAFLRCLTCPVTTGLVSGTDTITVALGTSFTRGSIRIIRFSTNDGGTVNFDAKGAIGGSSGTSCTTGNVTTVASTGAISAGFAITETSGASAAYSSSGGTATLTGQALDGETTTGSSGSCADVSASFTTQGTADIKITYTGSTTYGCCLSLSETLPPSVPPAGFEFPTGDLACHSSPLIAM